MERWDGPATLEWWANGSTRLGRFGVRVTAFAVSGDWTCEAVLDPALSENDRDAFDLLLVDPIWTLCFGEEGDLRVDVTTVDGDRLVLCAQEKMPTDAVAHRTTRSGDERRLAGGEVAGPHPRNREGDLMRTDDTTEWQKSSFSGNGPGNDCVEVAAGGDRICLREGDDPNVVLAPTDRAFGALLRHVKEWHA